jgi:chromosomal replication initiation ATPase DnaA
MTLDQHCLESLKMFGGMFEEVHLWLDEYAGNAEYGYRHRKKRHHEVGIREVIDLFGEKAAAVARQHIISDLKMEGWQEGSPFPKDEADYVCMGSRFRFENFVRDQSNSEAYAAAQMVAKGSACGMPVVIHSEAGLGKTHLLHAIGNEALRRDPKVRVALFSVEWFFRKFMLALQNEAVETFRDRIRAHYDLCLVEQLTFIDGKSQTQMELFLALKEHSANGCGIVLESALPLDDMLEWQDEFKAWLQSGINVGIIEPTAEARLAFLKRYLTEKGMPADDGLVECIHLFAGPTFRELEAAVIRLQAASRLESTQPTAEYAWNLFKR